MQDPGAQTLTALLRSARAGTQATVDHVFTMVYDELRRLASVVRSGRAGETYDTTALVHEAYLKLVRSETLSFNDRSHFMSIAARAMRQVLVDRAEAMASLKRGAGVAGMDVTLTDAESGGQPVELEQLIDLDHAMNQLAVENARAAQVIECRFFGGMSVEETAAALNVSLPTITRDWRYARAWLSQKLAS